MFSGYIPYFDRFPDFDHNPRCSIRTEFNRLAKAQKWDAEETKRERATCYNKELEGHFHRLGIVDQLERLKHLCEELGVKSCNSVADCRKVRLSSSMVTAKILLTALICRF